MALPLFAFAAAWQRLDAQWRWRSTWLRVHADFLGGLLLIGLWHCVRRLSGHRSSGPSGLNADLRHHVTGRPTRVRHAELQERIQPV
jgi:hypothetical protein